MTSDQDWQRLSPRMLLVHPVHELLRELPLLIVAVVFGSTTGNQLWAVAVLLVIAVVGVTRWFTTSYRIEPDPEAGRLQLRSGVLRRTVLSVPRNRIRSVQTEARLLHRLLGLTVLRVSTGQQASGDREFQLDAVDSGQVPGLRALLLTRGDQPPAAATAAVVLARWRPAWLRYSPLSLSGLVMIGAGVWALYQSGLWAAVQDSPVRDAVLSDAVERIGLPAIAAAVLGTAVLLAVLRSLVTYGNLVLTRGSGLSGLSTGDVLALRYGLLRVREYSYDMRRLRGGTLRRPLLVRLLGGARLDAAMTGVTGLGESSLLLPPCPVATAESVLAGLVGDSEPVSGPLRRHGPAAVRRRWTRAMAVPAVAGIAFAVAGVPAAWWLGWELLTLCCALLAADRVRGLGHRVDAHWLVARTGSWERRRYCIATAGIVAWTVRQTWFQRRAGVATLVAATAAGVKAYRVLDVPQEWAWSVAAAASPWVAESAWAR